LSVPLTADTGPEAVAPRIRKTFDFGWKFRRGDFSGAHMPEFSDSDWTELDLDLG